MNRVPVTVTVAIFALQANTCRIEHAGILPAPADGAGVGAADRLVTDRTVGAMIEAAGLITAAVGWVTLTNITVGDGHCTITFANRVNEFTGITLFVLCFTNIRKLSFFEKYAFNDRNRRDGRIVAL